MNYQRYLIEFGTGADLHGMDATGSAKKAVKDAMSHCCLCGVRDLLHIGDAANAMHVEMVIGSPVPEQVDTQELGKMLPFGTPEITVVQGGLLVKGLREPRFGDGDHILMTNAALTIWIDTDLAAID